MVGAAADYRVFILLSISVGFIKLTLDHYQVAGAYYTILSRLDLSEV